jgi:DNA repair exonuclease SbcCD ATPase subunit
VPKEPIVMNTWIRTLAVLGACLFAALAVAPAASAQDRATALEAEARRRFDEMHQRMQKLQVVKAETDPDEAAVLAAGNRFIQERQVRTAMDEVGKLITGGRYDEAIDRMDGLQQDLQRLLDLLLARDSDLEDLLAEIERLEKYRDRVDQLLDEQRREKDESAKAEALERHLQELDAAREAAQKLLDEQKALREEANQAGLEASEPKAGEMAEREGSLKQRAENLADKLDKIEKDAAKLGTEAAAPKDGEAKGTEPKDGQPQPSEPKSSEPKPATEPKPPAEPKPSEPKDSPPSDAKPGSCSGSCKGAAGAMGKAQQKLQQNKPERSLEDMDEAMRKLQQTVQQLEQMSEEAKRQLLELPFEQQIRAQEQTRIDTDRLAEDMEGDDAKSAEEGQPQQTPGKKNVQQAVPKQKAAAGQLKEYKPGKAKQDQQDAAEQLEQAKKELEDALAQLRQQLQDEVLRALEERFGAMLEKQKELSARTKAADRLAQNTVTASGAVPAQVVERALEIAVGEHQLAGEAGDAMKLLEEEGTSAAFPAVVELLRDDLTRVAGRLEQAKTAQRTQALQADIEQTLKDLIDALRRQIEMNAGQGGSCMCNGQPVLVPMSAELKLVMIKQKHVNRKTTEFDERVPEAERAAEDAKAEAEALADQQGKVEDLLRKMAVKMAKDAQAGGR